MKKSININGINFEECKPIHQVPSVSTRNLCDCYTNPSIHKRCIWKEWTDWFIGDCNSFDFGVYSYNCNFFTIEGLVEFENKMYYIYITKSHNRAYEII